MNNIKAKKVLFILQGHSGSGKSEIVKHLRWYIGYPNTYDCYVSADDYFTNEKGNYNFDESQLDKAHMECLIKVVNAMKVNKQTVWLDNTNCKYEDVNLYLNKATQYGYEVAYIRATGNYESKAPVEIVKQQKQDLKNFKWNN